MSVATELSENLLLRRNFSDADDLSKQYGGLIYKQGTQYSRLPTSHTVYDFLRFFDWVKKFLPIFHFKMLAGLQFLKNLVNSRKLLGFTFLMFSILYVLKNAQ